MQINYNILVIWFNEKNNNWLIVTNRNYLSYIPDKSYPRIDNIHLILFSVFVLWNRVSPLKTLLENQFNNIL
jgi:hypothetical protein